MQDVRLAFNFPSKFSRELAWGIGRAGNSAGVRKPIRNCAHMKQKEWLRYLALINRRS